MKLNDLKFFETNDIVSLQIIHPGRILKLRVRGTKRDLVQETSSEELCVVMKSVIARFDGLDIKVYDIFSARFCYQY